MASQSQQALTSSGDPTMSLNSKGEEVPTTSVWSWSRFFIGLKRGRMPISVVLVLFIVPLAVGVAVITWVLTYSAALTSASNLANSLQARILSDIVGAFTSRIQTLERAVDEHSRNWRDGHFSAATDADKFKVVDVLLNSLVPNVGSYSCLHFTLVPEGVVWGADSWTWQNQSWFYVMTQHGMDFEEYSVDPDGSNMNLTNPDSTRVANMTDIDWTNSSSAAWTKPYMWASWGYATHSRAIFQNGAFIGVQAGDFVLEFVADTLRELAGAISYKGYIYAFDLDESGDILLGSSINYEEADIYRRNSSTGDPIGMWTLPELAANETYWEPVRVLHSHLLRNTPNGTLYDYIGQPNRPVTLEFQLSDGVYIVQMRELSSLNLRWGIVHFVRRDDILAELTRSTKKTVGSVAGVVAGGIIITVVFSFFLAQALHRITRDLVLLSDFKFKEVLQKDLDKGSGVAKPTYSSIAEL
ncbi:hypothetical protein HK104_010686 [Borealophlyctis nickersoniae]|nr:hypothetical protein HK104_010686 [Borealophlyctis nickersoniae]